jgi:TRAP-type C4-dicarboxylate transport system permease small subunit
MAKTLGTIKKYMNKVLAACCAVLLTFMTFLVLWQGLPIISKLFRLLFF